MLSEERLRADLRAAMKRRDMPTVYVLRGVLAAAANLRIERGVAELSAAELTELVRREAKKREEAEEFARRAGRSELVEQNVSEHTILERYLPRMLSEEELGAQIRAWIGEGLQAIGPVMARLKERYPGQYDGKRASDLVRRVLAGS